MKRSRPFLYTKPQDVLCAYHEEEDQKRSFFILEAIIWGMWPDDKLSMKYKVDNT